MGHGACEHLEYPDSGPSEGGGVLLEAPLKEGSGTISNIITQLPMMNSFSRM